MPIFATCPWRVRGTRRNPLLEQGGLRRPAGAPLVAPSDRPRTRSCLDCDHPDLRGSLPRRRPDRDDHALDAGRRRGAGLLHDLGQPRPHARSPECCAPSYVRQCRTGAATRFERFSRRPSRVWSSSGRSGIRAAEMREDGDNGIHRGGTEPTKPCGRRGGVSSSCGRPETGRVAGRNGRRVAGRAAQLKTPVVWGALSCAGLSMPPALRAARRSSSVVRDFGSVPPR